MNRRLIFRVDANTKIGMGHLSRCVAVAEMVERDFDIVFVSCEENRIYVENLSIQYVLETIESDIEFIDFINSEDIVWLDGYYFDEDFKGNLRSRIYKLIETNDVPYKAKHVDLLFNHTPGINAEQFGIVESEVKLYLGLDYALLRSTFLEKAKDDQDLVRGDGIFVCFGGSDRLDLGLRFVRGLTDNKFKDIIYWVSNKPKEQLPNLGKNVCVLSALSQDEMIKYMSKSKILLISSSVLSIEALALRKPFYTGFYVDNQKLIAQGLKESGLAVGCRNLEIYEEFEKGLAELINFYLDEDKQKKLLKRQQKYIDGYSNSRIREILKSL